VAKPSREPQGRLIGPAWDESLEVAVSLDHVANDPNAHASPMRRASLIKNEGTTVKAEANESSRDMPRLRLRLLSRPVSCDCSTPPNPDAHRILRNSDEATISQKAQRGFSGPTLLPRRRDRIKDTDTVFLDGQRLYYNHIRPHQGLNGKTPAEVAGLDLALDKNKWESLIKKASQIR